MIIIVSPSWISTEAGKIKKKYKRRVKRRYEWNRLGFEFGGAFEWYQAG